MNIKNFFYGLAIIIMLGGCTAGSYISKTNQTAETAYLAGDYNSALIAWEEIITAYKSKGKKAEGKVYCDAGKAALALGQNEKAITYLNEALYAEYADAEMYFALAKAYQNIDNLSKEIMALEDYKNKFPEEKEIKQVWKRLFETYVESENWDLGLELWVKLDDESRSENKILEGYLIVNQELGNDDVCDEMANQLLKNNADNIVALEWKAKKYFYKAENRYQKEMAAYEKHKTRKQYAKLLKALDVVNENFRVSLKYYKKLYKLNPDSLYAHYLGNIYARFNDKEKAAFYRSKVN
ncbi:MAG: hypothetical protein K8R41_00755 [Bacteroidales bacterium]|nr:hypothetical protein [Bacteroidales bacterium]